MTDQAPPPVEDHAFRPRAEWWSLCAVKGCGRAMSAHETVAEDVDLVVDDDGDPA